VKSIIEYFIMKEYELSNIIYREQSEIEWVYFIAKGEIEIS
jgi:hypothetical protein